MFRTSGRRPPTDFDEATVERLLDGGSIDDLPNSLRPLGEVLAAVKGAPTAEELEGATTAAASFVVACAAAGRSPRRTRSVGASVFAMLVLAGSTGTAVAATQGNLPEPVQQVAHEALGVVGVSVPGIDHGHGTDPSPLVTSGDSTIPGPAIVGTPTFPGGTTNPASTLAATTPDGSGSAGNSTSSSTASPEGDDGAVETPPATEAPAGPVEEPSGPGGGKADGPGSPKGPGGGPKAPEPKDPPAKAAPGAKDAAGAEKP